MNVAESTAHAAPERRANPRTRLQKLAYIHVEPDNGVIVLDVSNGGIRFCAATALADTDVLRLRLSLQNNLRVSITARLIWMDPTMKSGGLQFDALPAGGLERVVRDWLDYSGLPTHAGKTISPPPPSPTIPILATIPPSPRAANTPAVKVLEPSGTQAVALAAAAVMDEPAAAEVKVTAEGNASAAKPFSPQKKTECEPDKGPEIAGIPALSTTLAVPPPLVADVPATKASEPPAAETAAVVEAIAAQPLLRAPEKEQLAPPQPPPTIPAIPVAQAAPANPIVTDRASSADDPARAILVVPHPRRAPLKTAAIVRQRRPANAPRKMPIPAPRPIVARVNAYLAKKTAPREFIGVAVAVLLLLAILVSLPVFFRNSPATSETPATVSVANPHADEALPPAPDAGSQFGIAAHNPSRAQPPATASTLTAAEPKSPNVGSPAAPASDKALNPAPADSAFASKAAPVPSAKVDASGDPAGARDLRAATPAAGFGAPVAVPLAGVSSAPRDGVRTGEFNSLSADAPLGRSGAPNAKIAPAQPVGLQPAVIFDKPSPAYTEEARKLAIEGEVTLDVIFSGAGQVQVLRVAKGLGHGLDESAVSAAQQIRFRPAMQNGQPVDFPATLHITFQLAF